MMEVCDKYVVLSSHMNTQQSPCDATRSVLSPPYLPTPNPVQRLQTKQQSRHSINNSTPYIFNKDIIYHTMNLIHSTLDTLRDRWAPISHTSTFRATGQVTPQEFVLAGDYLVYKFPTWSWSDASAPSKRVSYLPPTKQFLITRGVPCHRRLDENFAGDAGQDEAMVQDGFAAGGDGGGGAGGEDDGWLRTGGLAASQEARMRDVRTVDESGNVGDREEEEEIPDMEDEDDDEEAIIRDPKASGGAA